nr:Chain C, Coat protein [synthetic construct]1XOK_D Chain D, Coat protein [synthetic construct]
SSSQKKAGGKAGKPTKRSQNYAALRK